MTGLSLRMSRLKKRLINLRVGPGAAVLPKDLHSIRLDFAQKTTGGHLAARKVWRQYLPRLKYHNPWLAITTNRTTDQAAPSVMTIGYADGRQETIDMKNQPESEVLAKLLNITKATPIAATIAEEAELKRIAEQEIRSEEQRVQERMRKEEVLREEQLLAQARGQVVEPT